MLKYILLSAGLLINTNSYANGKWFVSVKNNSNHVYKLEKSTNQCWYLENLSIPQIMPPDSFQVFETHESHSFPSCIIGYHYLNIVGFFPELSQESIHLIHFSNVLDLRYVPYSTYEKKIHWLNYSDKPQRNYISFDHNMSCDSKIHNGDSYVFIEIKNNGDAIISGSQCQTSP